MLIFDGKTYREATSEEIAEFEKAIEEEKQHEEERELSADEIVEAILEVLS